MKTFLIKFGIFFLSFIFLTLILVFSVPKDEDAYLNEYNHKVELLEKTNSPRIIFVGGSNVAFGIDSKRISDSLKLNAINFGLHASIGMKKTVEDCLERVVKGDIVIFQFEYAHFFNGGEGDIETYPQLLRYTNFRNTNFVALLPTEVFIFGFPRIAINNLRKLVFYPVTGTLEGTTIASKSNFKYSKRGFNEYGDEVGHYNAPSVPYEASQVSMQGKPINQSFIKWLTNIINDYQHRGAKVYMLPPVCIKSQFAEAYSDDIEVKLEEIGHPFIVSPSKMVLDDKYTFDTGYHVNKDGVYLNTSHIIECLQFLRK